MLMNYLARVFEHNRLWIAGLIVAITAAAAYGMFRPEVEEDESGRAPANNSQAEAETKPRRRHINLPSDSGFSLTDAQCVLVIDADNLFTPETLDAVRTMVDDVVDLDVVANVTWVEQIPILNLFGLPDPILPPRGSTQERLDLAKAKALKHPLVKGQFLSDDGNALRILIKYDWLFVTNDQAGADEILAVANESLKKTLGDKSSNVRLQMTGHIPIWRAAEEVFNSNHRKFQIISYSLVFILAAILFRGIVPIIIAGGAPALAIFWTIGLLRLLDQDMNQLTSVILPVMISMVGITDGIHLMVHIRSRCAEGLTPLKAASSAVEHVGLACALTSLTTAIGFASLLLAHSEFVRDFGLHCGFGVFLSFLAVVTLIPLLSSTPLGRTLHRGHERDVIGQKLESMQGFIYWVTRHSRSITAAGILLTIGFVSVGSFLRPDSKIAHDMPANNAAYEALKFCDREFGGNGFVEVKIYWPEEIKGNDSTILAATQDVRKIVDKEPLLNHPLSIDDIVSTFPADSDSLDNKMSFIELLPASLRNIFFNPDYRESTLMVRVQDRGSAVYNPVFNRLDEGLDQLKSKYPTFGFDLKGWPVRRARNQYQVVVDLATSLGTASIVILFVMGIAYRSLTIGLIAMIPNLLPLAVTAALLVFIGKPLNITSVCAFTVCLGIAVDDSIHFLSRFQQEMKEDGDVMLSIRRSFSSVGKALVITTIILLAGFGSVVLSNMPHHKLFGMMACATLTAALIGDMLFLPAMLSYFLKSTGDKKTVDATAAVVSSAGQD